MGTQLPESSWQRNQTRRSGTKIKINSAKLFFGNTQRFNFQMQTSIMGRQEFLTLFFLFQSQNGFANLATEKPGKMDVSEALDLSEKLVCTDRQPPVGPRVPCSPCEPRGSVNTRPTCTAGGYNGSARPAQDPSGMFITVVTFPQFSKRQNVNACGENENRPKHPNCTHFQNVGLLPAIASG